MRPHCAPGVVGEICASPRAAPATVPIAMARTEISTLKKNPDHSRNGIQRQSAPNACPSRITARLRIGRAWAIAGPPASPIASGVHQGSPATQRTRPYSRPASQRCTIERLQHRQIRPPRRIHPGNSVPRGRPRCVPPSVSEGGSGARARRPESIAASCPVSGDLHRALPFASCRRPECRDQTPHRRRRPAPWSGTAPLG